MTSVPTTHPAKAPARGARAPQVASPPPPSPAPTKLHPIRIWREELRITRSELARKAAVKPKVIEGLENGIVRYCACNKAVRIAAAIGISTDALVEALVEYWGDSLAADNDAEGDN